ncbi:MAG: hypothetical protein ACMG6S_08940 [Byssovorax sp.]
MTTSPRLRSPFSPLLPAAMLGLLALGACNAIFGIEAGLPGGVTGTETGPGGAGGGSSSSAGISCSSPSKAEFTPRKLVGALSPGSDSAGAVVYDAKDDLIVAGLFTGTSIDLGKALARVSATEVDNGFVVKYDSSGAYLWGQAFGGTRALRLNAAGVDDAGNIYLTGAVAGQANIGGTMLDIASATSADEPDALVVALTPLGAVRWVKSFGNGLTQRGHRIAVDADGNSYIAGVSQDKVDFGDGTLIGDAGSGWWSFFLKLDSTGKLVWAQPFGSWVPNLASDTTEYFEIAVALDGKEHVIVGSTFNAPIFFGAASETPVGDADAFVASLDATDGETLWHRTFHQAKGGPAPDGNQWITSLTVDPCSGDIYAAGGFTQGIDFESRGSAKAIGDADAPDIFVARLAASDGAPMWFKAYGDYGRQDVTAVKVAPDGAVLLNGFLLSSPNEKGVDFGAPGGPFAPLEASAPDYADAFLLKLDSSGGYLWGLRSGDQYPQAAFDVAVDSTGKIASCGIATGTFALGGTAPSVTFSGFHGFVARFDP